MKITINRADVRRHGDHIRLGQGRTAIERMDGHLAALEVRAHGKQIKWLRGSSHGFADSLTGEDRDYLAFLGSDA